MQTNQFHQKNGLTRYAMACGYIQRLELARDGVSVRLDLFADGACYHVRAHEFDGAGRLFWECFDADKLTKARDHWRHAAAQLFAREFAAVARDKRYTFGFEWYGSKARAFVARFCGDWIGAAETIEGARLKAWAHLSAKNGSDDE